MKSDRLNNVNIAAEEVLAPPAEIKAACPLPAEAEKFVFDSREGVKAILDRRDPRLLMVVGPCSPTSSTAAM